MMKKILFLLIAFILCVGTLITGCGDKNADEELATQGQEQEEEETIWGDESFGIDAKVDEELQDYRSIILYGIDNGDRSDIIMFICINKKTNDAKVFSVFRDTYMQMSDETIYKVAGIEREFFKCNHAYRYGGKYASMKELNRHLDMNARECFGMDWDAISHLVENLDGLEVDVTSGMIPWMNSHLSDENKIQSSGVQVLNGQQAVQYLRCRKDPGADATTRSARNQAVFKAIFEKAKAMSTTEKMELFESVIDECDTNMSNQTLTETLNEISSLELESLDGWPYDYKILTQDDGSYYYYVPETLKSNVIELHKVVFGQENYEPSETVNSLSEKIIEQKEHLK